MQAPPQRTVRITGVVVFGAFLALLNQTVMSPALPVIMADFAIDASTAQWIMSIYPPGQRHHGTGIGLLDRPFHYPSAVLRRNGRVSPAGTALCAAAPTFFLLICGRVLQAASGVLLPLVSVVPMLVFPLRSGTAMGMAGIVMSAGPQSDPLSAVPSSMLTGWRACLGCIVPLALAALVCAVFLLDNVRERKRPHLDVASSCSTVAFGGLLYGFPAPPRWDGRAQWCSGASSRAWPAWCCSRAVSCALPTRCSIFGA